MAHVLFDANSTLSSSSFYQAQSVPKAGQKRYKHTLDAMQTIYRTEGLRAFYKGIIPSLMGVSHVAVQFPLYEQAKLWASELHVELAFTIASLSLSVADATMLINSWPCVVVAAFFLC